MIQINLFSFVNSLEPKLLHFFIKHYKDLGIKCSNMYLIVHIEPKYISSVNDKIKYTNDNIYKTINILKKNRINYKITNKFNAKRKTFYVNKYINKLEKGTWLIYPDLDEFFDYKNKNIYDFIKNLEKDNVEIAVGRFCNRIANNYKLKSIDIKKNLFDQYPIKYYDHNNNIARKYVQTKICALKIKNKCKYHNTHRIENMKDYKMYNKELDVHHFKFTLYTLAALKNKYEVYKNIGRGYKIDMYKQQFDLFYQKDNKWYIKKDKLY